MVTLNTQQILLPKNVYIGDLAELRISFTSTEEIVNYKFLSDLDYRDYSIEKIDLSQTGLNYYQLSLDFVPWKIGQINFPSIELEVAPGPNQENPENKENLLIKIQPVEILSLVEQNKVTGLRSFENPLLIPGTSYKIYAGLILFILLLIFSIRLIVRHKQVAFFLKMQKQKRKYRKNKKKTIKQLQGLLKSKEEDKEIAGNIQAIMRKYLEVRFDQPFSRTVSSKIISLYDQATYGLSSESKFQAAENISAIFIRTDYVRYAQGSINSKDANFQEKEKSELIQKLIESIECLEKTPKTKEEEKEVLKEEKNV
ncbi:MAG: hypothetical protein K5866_02625 [Treponema sp.]|nr:hypothetical protein [Treponema sp.]